MTGKQLQSKRRELGLTQARLAELLGVAANTVARWERGERLPTGRLLDLAMEAIAARLRSKPAAA